MKRIVNGVTYNTDTATEVGRYTWDREAEDFGNDASRGCETLYQTRGGAFFLVNETTKDVWNERERESEERSLTTFTPMSRDQAQKWMFGGADIEVIRNPFGDPPEATADDDNTAGETVFVRMPATLKRAIEDSAEASELSVNVWMMRCAERCLKGQAG